MAHWVQGVKKRKRDHSQLRWPTSHLTTAAFLPDSRAKARGRERGVGWDRERKDESGRVRSIERHSSKRSRRAQVFHTCARLEHHQKRHTMHNVSVMKKKGGEAEKNYSTETRRYWFTVLRKDTGEETAGRRRYRKGLAFATSAVFIDRTSGDEERIFSLPFLVPHQALTSDRNYINSKHVFK